MDQRTEAADEQNILFQHHEQMEFCTTFAIGLQRERIYKSTPYSSAIDQHWSSHCGLHTDDTAVQNRFCKDPSTDFHHEPWCSGIPEEHPLHQSWSQTMQCGKRRYTLFDPPFRKFLSSHTSHHRLFSFFCTELAIHYSKSDLKYFTHLRSPWLS